MVGQTKLKNKISGMIEASAFPRFSIIAGSRGSGKKLLCEWISKQLNIPIVILPDVKAETIRECIEDAHKVTEPVLYVIPNAQNMSLIAINALLKVTEEPPNQVYFVMTCQDTLQLINTIISRATVFRLDPYTKDDILEYVAYRGLTLPKDETSRVALLDLCETPYEIEYIINYGVDAYYSFIEQVFENIATVSGANSFKIGNRIALTTNADADDKLDLYIFWKGFMSECVYHFCESYVDKEIRFAEALKITSKYLSDLRINGLNRQMAFDNWILDIRKCWM